MSSQNYLPLSITVRLLAPKDCDTLIMRRRCLVPFVPVSGIKFRVYNDETDDAMELDLTDVVFDTRASEFSVELEDSDARTAYQQSEPVDMQGLQDYYKGFGFRREYHG